MRDLFFGQTPPTMMVVAVPPGMTGGQPITVVTPDGRTLMATIPPGLTAGQQFQIQLPPPVAVATLVSPASAPVVAVGTLVGSEPQPMAPVPGYGGAGDPRVVSTDKGLALYISPSLRKKGDPVPRLVLATELAVETPPPFGRPVDPNFRYYVVTAPSLAKPGDRLLFEFVYPGIAAKGRASLVIPADANATREGSLFVAPFDTRKAASVAQTAPARRARIILTVIAILAAILVGYGGSRSLSDLFSIPVAILAAFVVFFFIQVF